MVGNTTGMTADSPGRLRAPRPAEQVWVEPAAPRAYLAACLAAVAFLGFVAGGLAAFADAYPARHLRDAYLAGTALYAQLTRYASPFPDDLWRPARTTARGVTVHDPTRAQEGLTLYTSGHAQKAFLIGMDGRVVHEWGVPFSAVWDDSAAVRRPRPDAQVYLEKAVAYPNGDLLALYVAVGDTPWGYGLVKLDKDSRVLWKYLAHAHHDVAVAADGTVYLLTQEVGRDDAPGLAAVRPPRIDDYVVVLSPEGRELRKVRLLDALLRSRYAHFLDAVPWYVTKGSGDYLHTNGVDVLDGTGAQRLPAATAGRVLLSFREINAVAILDLDAAEIVWATLGPWLRQHDPDLLPDGHLLLFDNQGNGGPGGMSRVIEVDPATLGIVWSYAGTADRPFESAVRSSQQRLANGDTLVVESDGGRLLEVTPEGETVWEYVNPVRGTRPGGGEQMVPIVFWAERLDPAYFDPGILGGRAGREAS